MIVPETFAAAVDASVAVRFASSAAALMARLSCDHAAGCIAEELLAAHIVMQCSGDLEYTEEWAHLTDDERARAVRALDGIFDLFQDDEAMSLWGHVTAELTTPEDAIREVGEWFRPFGGVHATGHLDPD